MEKKFGKKILPLLVIFSLAFSFVPTVQKASAINTDLKVFYEQITGMLENNSDSSILKTLSQDVPSRLFVISDEVITLDFGASEKAGYKDIHLFEYKSEAAMEAAFESFTKLGYEVERDERIETLAYGAYQPDEWGNLNVESTPYATYVDAQASKSTVKVAIVDTGIYAEHPWFEGRIVNTGTHPSDRTDTDGHGSHVAGIVANNTPSTVKILPIDVFGDDNESNLTDLVAGVARAISQDADVINISVSGNNKLALKSLYGTAISQGTIVVRASGNSLEQYRDVAGKGKSDGILAVGALAQDTKKMAGAYSNYGQMIDIWAPGSLVKSANNVASPEVVTSSGTSMAAPFVAAAAATICSDEHALTNAQVEKALIKASVKQDIDDPEVSLSNCLNMNNIIAISESGWTELGNVVATELRYPQTFSATSGTGTQTNPYIISTAAQLVALSADIQHGHQELSLRSYKLANNINLSGYENVQVKILEDSTFVSEEFKKIATGWRPIGTYATPFSGTFDGDGYEIENMPLKVNYNLAHFTAGENKAVTYFMPGLFGHVAGTVKNLTLSNAKILCESSVPNSGNRDLPTVGSIASYVENGTIENCSVRGGGITSKEIVGGLVGSAGTGALIYNCYSDIEIVPDNAYGAFALVGDLFNADSTTTITSCVSNSAISGTAEHAGILPEKTSSDNNFVVTSVYYNAELDTANDLNEDSEGDTYNAAKLDSDTMKLISSFPGLNFSTKWLMLKGELFLRSENFRKLFEISDISPVIATGSAITPAITVKYKDELLTAGTDYSLSYSNNTAVGTATIVITGIANFSGLVLNKNFVIKSANGDDEGGGGGDPSPSASIKPSPSASPSASPSISPSPSVGKVTSFTDIANHWAKNAILKMAEKGVVNGYNGDFRPDNTITRAEVIKILAVLSAEKMPAYKNEFSDVKASDWFATYVAWGSKNGIISGYEDGDFRSTMIVSKQEMAIFVSRYVAYKKIKLTQGSGFTFSDENAIASWASPYVKNMQGYGIVTGDDWNNFNPLKNITRAEAVTMVWRLSEKTSAIKSSTVIRIAVTDFINETLKLQQ